MLWSTILVAALASVASARKCRDIDVHVTISAENGVYDLEPLVKVDDVTNFYLHMVRQGANYPAQLQTGVSLPLPDPCHLVGPCCGRLRG